jgi:hypothetical protein
MTDSKCDGKVGAFWCLEWGQIRCWPIAGQREGDVFEGSTIGEISRGGAWNKYEVPLGLPMSCIPLVQNHLSSGATACCLKLRLGGLLVFSDLDVEKHRRN